MPLNEDTESYDLDVLSGASVVRSVTTAAPNWTYAAANQVADFGTPQGSYTLTIYQNSVLFGRGQGLTVTVFV